MRLAEEPIIERMLCVSRVVLWGLAIVGIVSLISQSFGAEASPVEYAATAGEMLAEDCAMKSGTDWEVRPTGEDASLRDRFRNGILFRDREDGGTEILFDGAIVKMVESTAMAVCWIVGGWVFIAFASMVRPLLQPFKQ